MARLARRIASFPADAVRSAKRVLNELTLPGATRSAPTPGGSTSWSPRTRPRPARPPCSHRACRPVARSNSTSATALVPCQGSLDDPAAGQDLEGVQVIGPLDDLECQPGLQLGPGPGDKLQA